MEKGPWFMGGKGLIFYLWFLELDPQSDILVKILVWLRLLFLPLNIHNHHTFEPIGNYIGNSSCSQI